MENCKKLENNRGLFNQVSVDIGGYGVSWNDEIDLAAEEIWENREEIEYLIKIFNISI